MKYQTSISPWQLSLRIALVYFLLGLAGLSFAIPPGYASPIFPAAGYAVAMALIEKNRAWAGILLGSTLLNVWVAFHGQHFSFLQCLLAAGIGIGATLQALAAAGLVKKFTQNRWRALEEDSDIAKSLGLAGPVACLVSASCGISLLYFSGSIEQSSVLHSWWNWWSGDVFGVLIGMPITLILMQRHQPSGRDRIRTILLPMGLCLMVVAGAFATVSGWERDAQKKAVAAIGGTLAQQLSQRIIAHQEALASLRRLIEVNPDMTYSQFNHFTQATLKDNPDIFALSFNQVVTRNEKPRFQVTMAQKTQQADYLLREKSPDRGMVPVADRPFYVAVAYIAPLESNRQALGYDIYSEPIRRSAIEVASKQMRAAVTAPIRLVQENKPVAGVLILDPAHRQSNSATAPRGPFAYAVAVIKVGEMTEIATRASQLRDFNVQLSDPAADAEHQILYQSAPSLPLVQSEYTSTQTIMLADRTWRLEVFPTQAYLEDKLHWESMAVGTGGMCLAALLQMLLLITTGKASLFRRKVDEQTEELKLKSLALEDRNSQLSTLFTLSPDGFVAVDDADRIRFVNPAFTVMMGLTQSDILGKHLDHLDDWIRSHLKDPKSFKGMDSFLGATSHHQPALEMDAPNNKTLAIVGLPSEAGSISRIFYVRDISKETEMDRMKSKFVAHAAHELRTPLTIVSGYSELLENNLLNESDRAMAIGSIHAQANWLVSVLNDMLDIAKLESMLVEGFATGPVYLDELIQSVMESNPIRNPECRYVVNLSAADHVQVQANEQKLRQALSNVVANAVKFTAKGSIEMLLVREAGRIGIRVKDSGIGMTEEQLSKYGERFWRADSTGQIPGTGLGVAITSEIMRVMHGTLAVTSRMGQGTTVTLWLPSNDPESTAQ